MAMGRPPLEPSKRRLKDPLVDILSDVSGLYSDKLIEMIEWSMTMDPAGRPQSAKELRQALIDYH